MNTKPTTKAAPAKRARARAATPAPAPADIAAAVEQEDVERVAERRAAAEKLVAATEGWVKVLKTAIKAGDGEGARAAAQAVANGAGDVRRVYGVRKAGTAPRPRTVPGKGEFVIVADGKIVKDSAYKPSVTRDVAMAKKRQRDGEARPATERYVGDEVMAQGKVMTRAEFKATVPA
jgi:hypothetical protein